jgi:endonuclease YncB( thermonuclease family)
VLRRRLGNRDAAPRTAKSQTLWVSWYTRIKPFPPAHRHVFRQLLAKTKQLPIPKGALPIGVGRAARVGWLVFLLSIVWQAPGAAQAPTPIRAPYVASARGEVYYRSDCDGWHSLAIQNLRWFASSAEAEAAGFARSRARGCSDPPSADVATPVAAGVCTIVRVIDGDTVACAEADERIRLLLIDAPEVGQGPAGAEARSALERLLPMGTRALVEIDVQERDRYGRILAYLTTPRGELVNEVMARQGYALVAVYPPNVRHVDRIRAASAASRAEGLGLWRGSAFECTPADYRAGRCQ